MVREGGLPLEVEVLWKEQVGESNVGDTSFFVRMAVHGPCLELGITELHAVGGDVRRSKLMVCIRWNVHWLDGTVVDGLLVMVMAQRRRGTYILSVFVCATGGSTIHLCSTLKPTRSRR